jgi:hypothetical protein
MKDKELWYEKVDRYIRYFFISIVALILLYFAGIVIYFYGYAEAKRDTLTPHQEYSL